MPLKFINKPQKAELPFRDGSTIYLCRPAPAAKRALFKQMERDEITDPEERGDRFFQLFISGWKDIEDGSTGKPLPFNPTTRAAIYDDIYDDETAVDKFFAFVGGVQGNLPAGSSISMNGDGSPINAANASKK